MNEKFALWTVLLRQYLKRDWRKISIWVLGLGLFSGAYVPAFKEIAKGSGLLGMYETMKNPAMISMVGPTPIKAAADYTIGAMYAQEMLLFCGLFALIIAALHVVGHTRKEEDYGLTELVQSFRVGRQANSFAVLVETILINVVLALLIAGVMSSFAVDSITLQGALLFGSAIGLAGILGAVIALLLAQIMPTAGGANGASLGLVGLLYIVRAGTDVSNIALSWFNPLGWLYLTAPFTRDRWLPVLYGVLFSLVVSVLALVLEGHRDIGAGYLPEREGHAHAKAGLQSIPGLFIRLNRGTIISWLVALLVMGSAYGSIYGDMQTFLAGNALMKQMFAASQTSIEASFTSTIMVVLVALAGILPVAVVNRLFTEETRLHLSQLTTTKVSRGQLYWTNVGLALVVGVLGVALAAGSLGATALATMDQHSKLAMPDFLAAGFNGWPMVVFVTGIAALALGWAPKWGKVAYLYLGYSFALNYFGGILDLPEWFAKTAVQTWLPRLPVAQFDGPTFLTLTALGAGLLLLGYAGYQRRDFREGA